MDAPIVKHRRQIKNIIINPKFQIKFIITMSLGAIVLTLCYNYIFYNFIQEHYFAILKYSDVHPQMKNEIIEQMSSIYFYLSLLSLAFTVSIIIWSIVVSHQIIGPMYKLKKVFNNIILGNGEQRAFFRKNDQFHDVATAFNELMDKIDHRYVDDPANMPPPMDMETDDNNN